MTSALAPTALAVVHAGLAAIYVVRWRSIRGAIPDARAWSFLAGIASLWIAVASPLASLDRAHLTAHMVQHLVLMTLAAPLLLLGEPAFVLLHGWRPLRLDVRLIAPHPAVCWLAGTGVVLLWHAPAFFEVGMRWHGLQHATFLFAGLLFWLPVIRPWPTYLRWSPWSIPLYLFLATLPCDALSAFLAFCGRAIYPRYCSMPGGEVSALDDQSLAGALMWFWVTVAYLVPAVLVTLKLLSERESEARP